MGGPHLLGLFIEHLVAVFHEVKDFSRDKLRQPAIGRLGGLQVQGRGPGLTILALDLNHGLPKIDAALILPYGLMAYGFEASGTIAPR